MLALLQSAQAKIVYTKTHHVIGENHLFLLDLNHDGTIDFTITNLNCAYGATSCTSSSWNLLTVAGGSGNAVEGTAHRFGFWAADLRAGTRIPNKRNSARTAMMASQCEGVACSVTSGTHTSGNWRDARDRYLGLRFQIHQKIHFGWARLSVKTARRPIEIKTTLTGFAYETTPNKPIIAGQTKGLDVITLEPGSLGALAAGSSRLHSGR
jgi:hypothetical protein